MALVFNPGSDAIRTAGIFDETGIVSVCFWARADANTANNQRIMGTNTTWEARFANQQLSHELLTGDPVTTSPTIFAGVWYHFVCNFQATTKSIYVNGVANPATTAANSTAPRIADPLALGTSSWNAAQGMSGALEDVRFYDREITQPEAQTMFAAEGRDQILDGLVNWWPLTDGVIGAAPILVRDHGFSKIDMTDVVGIVSYESSRPVGCAGGY